MATIMASAGGSAFTAYQKWDTAILALTATRPLTDAENTKANDDFAALVEAKNTAAADAHRLLKQNMTQEQNLLQDATMRVVGFAAALAGAAILLGLQQAPRRRPRVRSVKS
jgi:hypothetical protein